MCSLNLHSYPITVSGGITIKNEGHLKSHETIFLRETWKVQKDCKVASVTRDVSTATSATLKFCQLMQQ